MLNVDNGADEVGSRLFICGGTDNIIPELLTLLTCPAIATLVDGNDELLFPVKEGKELALLRFHNFPLIYESSAPTSLVDKNEILSMQNSRLLISLDMYIVSF